MLRTHYDCLKIARDAPPEVVRAAYRALSLKYHPDRPGAGSEATEMMAALNNAYDVLSDPQKRREYDDWISFVESKPARERGETWTSSRSDWIGAPGALDSAGSSRLFLALARFRHYWLFYVLALLAIFLGSLWYERLYLHRSKALTPIASAVSAASQDSPALEDVSPFAPHPSAGDPSTPAARSEQKPSPQSAPTTAPPPKSDWQPTPPRHAPAADKAAPASAPPSHAEAKSAAQHDPPSSANASKQAAQSAAPRVLKRIEESPSAPDSEAGAQSYTRPATAPNGEAWPSSSDYVAGYQQRNTNGLSQVVIDNTKNNSDAFVRIVSVGESEPKVVRNVFIQASDRFTAGNLRAGTYEIRYQNLDSGTLMRSEVFALEESAISSGTRYSTVTLTLRTRPDENMNTYALPSEEF
jgi:hypothetical protein